MITLDRTSMTIMANISVDCVDPVDDLFFSEGVNGSASSVTIDPWINFAFNGVGILLLATFGITANVLSVAVLCHPKLKSSLTTLLLGLTISDIFVIGTSLFIFSLSPILDTVKAVSWYTTIVRPHLLPWLLPIALTAQMSSLYYTVVITLERYVAVCLPLQARSLCTRSSANKSSLAVLLLSILYNIPRWFEYETVPVVENCTDLHNSLMFRETETEFRRGDNYILYYVNWAYLIVLYLIPFTILLQFNAAIYRKTKQHRTRRSSLSPTRVRRASEDGQLATMLLGIVLTFIACNLLALVINVMESFGLGEIGNLIPINNFLIVLSSSSNFIFYFVFGTQFRRRLKETLRLSRGSTQRSQDLRLTPSSEQQPQRRRDPIGEGSSKRAPRSTAPPPPLQSSPPNSSNDSNNNGNRRNEVPLETSFPLPASTEMREEELGADDPDQIPVSREIRSCSQVTVDTIISEEEL